MTLLKYFILLLFQVDRVESVTCTFLQGVLDCGGVDIDVDPPSNVDKSQPCTFVNNILTCSTINIAVTTTTTTTTTTTLSPTFVPLVQWVDEAVYVVVGIAGIYAGVKYWPQIRQWFESLIPAVTTTTTTTTTEAPKTINWQLQAKRVGIGALVAEGLRRLYNILSDYLDELEATTVVAITTAPQTTLVTTTTSTSGNSKFVTFSPNELIIDQCASGAEQFVLSLNNYDGTGGFTYRCENCIAQLHGSYDSTANTITITISLVSFEVNPILVVESSSCTTCTFATIPIGIDTHSCNTPQTRTFKKSLTASYTEKRQYSRMKMEYQTRYSADVSIEAAQQKVITSCYRAITSENLVRCSIIMSKDITEAGRRKRSTDNSTLYYMTAVAEFSNAVSVENKSLIQAAVTEDIEDDNDAQDVLQFLTPEDDLASFIVWVVFLSISVITAIVATVLRVLNFRSLAKAERSLRDLIFTIIFDFFWPILGIYPMIFVWYEYRLDSKLMYDPLSWISGLLMYISVFKLVIFIAKVICIESKSRKLAWTEKYPILLEVIMDYEFLSFIFCDSLELLVVYFFSSRFMQPETEVSIANFWFPVFQFGMSFVPAVYRIVIAIYKRTKQKANGNTSDAVSNASLDRMNKKEKKFKFIIAICTETIEIVVILLTLALFICSLGVTLCVPGDITYDSRQHAIIDGIPTTRNASYYAAEKAKVPLPGLCKLIKDEWFGDRIRFGDMCLKADEIHPDTKLTIQPSILGDCANPLEWIIFWAIMVAILLQIVILLIFVSVRYGQIISQRIKREQVYHSKSRRERKYDIARSISKSHQILEHTSAAGRYIHASS